MYMIPMLKSVQIHPVESTIQVQYEKKTLRQTPIIQTNIAYFFKLR